MKFFENLANALATILQALLFGIFLAFLRNKCRWLYYPLKWITTTAVCFMLGAFLLVIFKLGCEILGIKISGSGVVDVLSSGGLTGMVVWLLVMGSFVTSYIDFIIFLIEKTLFGGSFWVDVSTGKVVDVTPQVWNPTAAQSLFWNLYGFGIIIFLWFRLAS